MRSDEADPSPRHQALCAGFEKRKWRYDGLAQHLLACLLDFVFRPGDIEGFDDPGTFLNAIRRAAYHVYSTDYHLSRGEVGELLLHIACRHHHGTFPAVSKLFFKTASNEIVRGFDLVHTTFDEESNDVILWLGEAKFYTDGHDAVRAAIASIKSHLDLGFLQGEKFLIGPKISPRTPGYEKIQWLFDLNTSLNEVVQRMVIPVMIAYDSASTERCGDEYDEEIIQEIADLHARFIDAKMEVDLICMYLPMSTKSLLSERFSNILAAHRPIAG